jgi:hypothetical protein
MCFNYNNIFIINLIQYPFQYEREERPMKKYFLSILTASILLLGVAGFASNTTEETGATIQKLELPGSAH